MPRAYVKSGEGCSSGIAALHLPIFLTGHSSNVLCCPTIRCEMIGWAFWRGCSQSILKPPLVFFLFYFFLLLLLSICKVFLLTAGSTSSLAVPSPFSISTTAPLRQVFLSVTLFLNARTYPSYFLTNLERCQAHHLREGNVCMKILRLWILHFWQELLCRKPETIATIR